MPTWDDVVEIGPCGCGGKGMCRLRTDPDALVVPVKPTELADLLEDAWRIRAPKRMVAEYDASGA